MRDRFAIYVGRIDENKGCVELFDFFEHYSASLVDGMHLVLIGTRAHSDPDSIRAFITSASSRIRTSTTRWPPSELLIMPSYLESLSMVALEAWAMGKPVLANAKCDVLQGQCLRSNAGLFYENFDEFAETMRAIDTTPSLQAALGRNGRAFFERHYAWPVIEKKYVDMLQQLSKESAPQTMEPMPGWFARRRRSQPPADDVVKKLPTGPYRENAEGSDRHTQAEGRSDSAAAADGQRQKQRPARPEPRPERRDFRPQISTDHSRRRRGRPRPITSGRAASSSGPKPKRAATPPQPQAAEGRQARGQQGDRARARSASRAAASARPPAGWRRRRRALRRRWRRCRSMRRDHQVLATLGYGDAIGHEVLGIQRVLRGAGYESEIFVQTADPRLEHLTQDYRDLADASHPDNILIHHFSIGSRASRMAYALPDRMVLVYHNITPPEYFVDINKELVRLCFRGRRELALYKSRCDLALGDSEYNRAGARRARLLADRRARCRAGLRSPWRRRPTTPSPARSTTTGSTCCLSAA